MDTVSLMLLEKVLEPILERLRLAEEGIAVIQKRLDENPKRTRGVFVAPLEEEVSAYCWSKGYHFSPSAFVAFYESKGWKIGTAPMRSWHAACATWEERWRIQNGYIPPVSAEPIPVGCVYCGEKIPEGEQVCGPCKEKYEGGTP